VRVLFCGSRQWQNPLIIELALRRVCAKGATHLIHGAAQGADLLSARAAKQMGLTVTAYPADWKLMGKRAGVARNTQMLEQGKPDWVIAFADDLRKSPGTRDMIGQALEWPSVTHVFHFSHVTGWRELKAPGKPQSFAL